MVSEFLPEIIRPIAATVILLVLMGASIKFSAEKIRGWRMVLCGLALLMVGTIFSIAHFLISPQEPFFGNEIVRQWVEEIVGYGLGLLLICFGLLRMRASVTVDERLQELEGIVAASNQDLQTARELFNSVLKSAFNGIMILRAVRDEFRSVVDFEFRLVNPGAEQILGRTAGDLIGARMLEQFPCIRTEGLFDEGVSVFASGLPVADERYCSNGRIGRWYQFVAVRHGDGLVVTFADVSDRKHGEELLLHAAQHDALTGLPNRSLFTQQLQHAMDRGRRYPDYRFAVLFLDFDRFKIINDSLGHEVGDQLLLAIAARLRANLRSTDIASHAMDGHLPARLGGDEFVILLDGVSDLDSVVAVAERLQAELSAPHILAGHEVISTASIGIVMSHSRYDRPEDILRDADTAMYRAKTGGKARHVVFDEQMHEAVVSQLNLERDLREAVGAMEFLVHYQPIVTLESGRLSGFEALIRWPHPQRGLIEPNEFIPLAEEIGLIVPIGEWVIAEAAKCLKRWQTMHPNRTPLTMSVNLSRQQLVHDELVDAVQRVLHETGINPATFRLEITETLIMEDIDALERVMLQLKQLGVQLVMDDFGTGHSSLASLHQLPFDALKIDRSFINSAGGKRDYAAIVHAVVTIALNLDMEVVAEGVETEDQLTLLQGLDCTYGQGHLFSEAVDLKAAEKLLKRDFGMRKAA